MVNILLCELSLWRGDGEMCRWCNAAPARGGRNYCSRECMAEYADNHYYFRGRERVGEASRTDCGCRSMSPQGAYLDENMRVQYLQFKPPHRTCAACGECEQQIWLRGDKLTCNHIVPREGLAMNVAHCIHHMTNLEMLCWHDHELLNKLGNKRHLLDRVLGEEE
jgi:hypothetical protein